MGHCGCEGLGVSGTPSTDKSTCAGMCEGCKPPGVCSSGGLGERVGERAYEVLLEHLRGIVEDVAALREELRKALSDNGFRVNHAEPDYMAEDVRPARLHDAWPYRY